ncbi:MAG TPA: hypothetical protein VFJ70_18620 [Burkholderiales bacterium]|nr:hypothetical protein [Burkholderiales bacterium]
MYRNVATIALAAALAACQTMGGLTVKDYTSKSGQRVMAGQAEPKSEYGCAKLAQEKEPWGIKGNMDKVGSMQRVTATAVENAPVKGANYAYIMAPADIGVGSVNVNAWSAAQVAYYKCTSLPAASR